MWQDDKDEKLCWCSMMKVKRMKFDAFSTKNYENYCCWNWKILMRDFSMVFSGIRAL